MGLEWQRPSVSRNRRGTTAAIFVTFGFAPVMLAAWWMTPPVCGPRWITPAITAALVIECWRFALFSDPKPPPRARSVWLVIAVALVVFVALARFPVCS